MPIALSVIAYLVTLLVVTFGGLSWFWFCLLAVGLFAALNR